jgi:hypothetical protein
LAIYSSQEGNRGRNQAGREDGRRAVVPHQTVGRARKGLESYFIFVLICFNPKQNPRKKDNKFKFIKIKILAKSKNKSEE